MGVPKTSDHIQIEIKMQNLHHLQKPPKQDLKDVDILCTFKIMIESPNFKLGCIKDS